MERDIVDALKRLLATEDLAQVKQIRTKLLSHLPGSDIGDRIQQAVNTHTQSPTAESKQALENIIIDLSK